MHALYTAILVVLVSFGSPSFGGQPIFGRMSNSPYLLTRSEALVSSQQHHQQKSMYLMIFTITLVFAFSWAKLKSRPSDLVLRYTPSIDVLTAYFKSWARKCQRELEPVHSLAWPHSWCRSGWTYYVHIRLFTSCHGRIWWGCGVFGGQPNFGRMSNSLSLLTRSKALVRSMKAM